MTKFPVLILGARSDMELRHHEVPVTLHEFNALMTETHVAFVDGLPELPQIAVCVIGMMARQKESERDNEATVCIMRSNYEVPAGILAILADRFEERRSGTLVGISSVAGERGRATNYVYGSAKAGFTAFLSGLRNRLAKRGVHVVTVLPGFVATQMTEGLDLPEKLTAEPGEVADAIARAVERKKDVVYVRPVWRLIMLVIRSIPEFAFKKLRI